MVRLRTFSTLKGAFCRTANSAPARECRYVVDRSSVVSLAQTIEDEHFTSIGLVLLSRGVRFVPLLCRLFASLERAFSGSSIKLRSWIIAPRLNAKFFCDGDAITPPVDRCRKRNPSEKS
jgi:hypothetical protein